MKDWPRDPVGRYDDYGNMKKVWPCPELEESTKRMIYKHCYLVEAKELIPKLLEMECNRQRSFFKLRVENPRAAARYEALNESMIEKWIDELKSGSGDGQHFLF